MQQPEDIAHLYQEFGGNAETYREITREREARQARQRWPLISALNDLAAGVPSVQPGETAGASPQDWHGGRQPAPPVPAAAAEPQPVRIEPTGLLHTQAAVAPATPPAAPLWGHASAPAPAPVSASIVYTTAAPLPAAPAPAPAAPASSAEGPALHSPSPLARLARPAQAEAAPSTGLQQVFARLLGMKNRP